MSGEDNKKSFWNTIPGILTGIAAVLTAIGGLIVAYHTLVPGEAPAENQMPTIKAIEFNPISPSDMGDPILVTVRANDSDNDKINYRFMIKGPTDQEYRRQADWSTDNKWEWIPTVDDVGDNRIRVYVRDEKHSDKEGNFIDRTFKITKDASALNSDALVLYSQGKYDEAIKAYGEAIILDPNYKEAFFNRGLALAALARYDEAIQDYDVAIELDPKNKESFFNRGLAFAALDKFNEAIQDYDVAIKLDPKNEEAFYNKGLALAARGNCSEAIKAYDEAVILDPNYNDAIVARESAGKGGSIRVKCEGGYVARFTLAYKLEGAVSKIKSGSISIGKSETIPIPACATDISLIVEEFTLFDWKTILAKKYNEPVTKCFRVSGTTLDPNYKDC